MRLLAVMLLVATGASCGRQGIDLSPDQTPNDAAPDAPPGASHDTSSDVDARPGLDLPPYQPGRYRAIAVTVGRLHSCAILDDHRVKCWGDNGYGQLGLGDLQPRGSLPAEMGDNLPPVDLGTGRRAKAISAGHYTTCALLDDDSVKCWGYGLPSRGPEYDANGNYQIGDQPGEMGDALRPIDLGPGRHARLVALGYYSIGCIVRDDESTLCWSSPLSTVDGPAPAGHRVVQLIGAAGVLGLFDDGAVLPIHAQDPIPGVSTDGGLAPAIAVGGTRVKACALYEGGITSCSSPPTTLSPPPSADAIALAFTETGRPCWLRKAGGVECLGSATYPWGVGGDDQSSSVRLGGPAVALASGGADYFCALLVDGDVKCWSLRDTADAWLGGSVATADAWPSVDLGMRLPP